IVDTVGEGDIGTLRGGADEDLLGSRVEVGAGLVGLREAAGGFEGDVDVELAPGQLRGILLSVDLDRLAIDDDRVVGGLDGVVETAERGVELQQPGEIRDGAEVIDGHDFEFTAALDQGPKGVASDAAETVDSNASQCHSLNTGFVLISPSRSFPHHSDSGQTDNLRKLIARLIARYRKFQASVIGVSARPRRTVREPSAKVATSAPAGVSASPMEGMPASARREDGPRPWRTCLPQPWKECR